MAEGETASSGNALARPKEVSSQRHGDGFRFVHLSTALNEYTDDNNI